METIEKQKLSKWFVAMCAVCAVLSTAWLVLAVFYPLPERPITATHIEILPDWALWMHAHSHKLITAGMAIYAPIFAAIAAYEWRNLRE